jgi:cytochrome c oxidase subunit II
MLADIVRGWLGGMGGIDSGSFWLPREGSTTAPTVDHLFNVITWISIFFFALITVALIYFVWKYRARPGQAAEISETHNRSLEITWTVVPLLIAIWIFWQGFTGYMDMQTPPGNAYEVQVLGQKWKWLFTYPNGVVDENLHVPPGEPVRLIETSQDVIHSLFIPEFRIKRDAVPGRYEKQWFQADTPGEYQIFCAEYCGTQHSSMLAKVIVHTSRADFDRWLADAGNFLAKLPPEDLWKGGEKLYNQRGCKQCHSIDGTAGIGPSFKGIWGHPQPLRGGGSATVDENYLRESILEPQAKVVQGFEPVMPTFQGRLKDKEITALIEYVKHLQ